MNLRKGDTINITILALGGQGGGVLLDWIVHMAEAQHWSAQATSIAGVAQRTGATIYYIELVPPQPTSPAEPILALMPVAGDVDIVIASELMEAGRAVQRGLVTPQRTTVITSTHRVYAVQEKIVPGQGVADGTAILELVRGQSKRLIAQDMQALARASGSVISASLFGALAASNTLPFNYQDYEQAIRQGGIGVATSLHALQTAYRLADKQQPASQAETAPPFQTVPRPLPQQAGSARLTGLVTRIRDVFPPDCWDMVGEGLARVVDYQDAAYGAEYLTRLSQCLHLEQFQATGAEDAHCFTRTAAHWLAVAMSYDDMPRVADLKTRGARHTRIHHELKIPDGATQASPPVLQSLEYFHPRLEEILGLLPARLGLYLEQQHALCNWLNTRLDRGRRIRSSSIRGYFLLRFMASLSTWRRASLRHQRESEHWQQWLKQAENTLSQDRDLAIELLRCRQLIKGYSDTRVRGSGHFDALCQAATQLLGQPQAAQRLQALRNTALKGASTSPHA